MKIITLLLVLFGLILNANEWKELPEIGNHPNYIHTFYKSKDYNIRKDIDYFELRKFLFKDGKQLSDKYLPFHVISKKTLDSYSWKLQSRFKKLPFVDHNTSYIKNEVYRRDYFYSSPYYNRINGYFIKDDKVLWTINEKKDLLWVFDGIDTEAELATFLWLYDDDYIVTCEYRYKETLDGYIVEKTVRTYPYYIEKEKMGYIDHSTYILNIKRNGKFTIEPKSFRKEKIPYLVIPSPPRDLKVETAESILESYIEP